jgi:hypothetical protein
MDHIGTGQLLRSPEMMNMVYDFAREGMRFAQDISPRRTGEYRDSFRVEGGHIVRMEDEAGHITYRAAARLINDSEHAADVEWRWNHHILDRTIGRIQRTKFG